MVVKIYISGISGNKEVKKRQQRVLMILDSKVIKYDVIDITEPGNEADKEFMQNNSKSNGGTVSDPNPRSPLPPQVFNDDEYCGDYDQFDLANEVDTLEQFLKIEVPPEDPPQPEVDNTLNGDVSETKSEERDSKENSQDRDSTEKEIKEGTPLRETTPQKQISSKEGTPAEGQASEDAKSKEPSPELEESGDNDSVKEKEKSPEQEIEAQEQISEKEVAVNENGTESSRGQSEEKEEVTEVSTHKSDPSDALIESEKVAAAE